GGWIVTVADWRWIFGLFFIVAGCATALSLRWLPHVGYRDGRRLDSVGWMLTSVGAIGLVLSIRWIGESRSASPGVLAVAAASVAAIAWLVRRSLRRRTPIIEFRMFLAPTYTAAIVVGTLLLVCQLAY